ncbi:MAG TPA: dihydrolipoamide acetyltransferase family protein [Gemmatimonadales bacterium]
MATHVLMEALSPTMEEGRIAAWLKQEGDAVQAGDVIAEVETDKAIMELQARGHGLLRRILVPAGASVEVGRLIAVIADASEDISSLVDAPRAAAPAPPPLAPATATPEAMVPDDRQRGGRTRASPLARRMARERGLDLATIPGTGPGGRIVKRDVDATSAPAMAVSAPAAPSSYVDVVPGQLRKTIAKRLVQSLGPIPHFFLTSEIDMEQAADARASLNQLGDTKISFNDIVIKVVAVALTQHRECNAWWTPDYVRYFTDVHIAMAVAIDEGLITPVIRYAQRKSIRAIAAESRELAERARARKLAPDEYTGGTFSISNLGMLDISQFTAVINPPEAAILAIGAITEQPVVQDGAITIRRRMRVTMSCDHRVIDGAMGARFLQTVKRMLENPLAIVW